MQKEEFCFVIMPFNNEVSGVYYDAIKPAVESRGLKCIRVDEIANTGNIIKRIIEYITTAKVIIADLTGKNANVFYELGIAHCLGNNTIVIAQKIEEVPFDVKSYHVIVYKDTISGGRNLQQTLANAIETMPEWSIKSNNPVQDFLPEKLVSLGQYANTLEENKLLKEQVLSARVHLEEFERMRKEMEKLKSSQEELKEKAKELEIIQRLIGPMFQVNTKSGTTNFVNSVQEVVNRVQNEGEVSIPVPSNAKGGSKKRIIFTKIK